MRPFLAETPFPACFREAMCLHVIACVFDALPMIADRFVPMGRGRSPSGKLCLDLATGHHVRIAFAPSGTRDEQSAWSDACSRECAAGRLVDFGFIGAAARFEARPLDSARQPRGPCLDGVGEWLDQRSTTGLLRAGRRVDPRDIRLAGFVPLAAWMSAQGLDSEVRRRLAGRSVVLVGCSEQQVALAMLGVAGAEVREVRAVIELMKRRLPDNAAERRSPYGSRISMPDARAMHMMGDGIRLAARGRHAAAERALRSAAGAFERRGDTMCAARAQMALGSVLYGRGRAVQARALFDAARDQFQRANAAADAVSAAAAATAARVDAEELADAVRCGQLAYSAACALRDAAAAGRSAVELARALIWRAEHSEARILLESAGAPDDPEVAVRHWCLRARLQIAARDLAGAWDGVRRARSLLAPGSGNEALVRRWEAATQAGIGDLEAARVHITRGIEASHACHHPMQALKLRLTWIEALLRHERFAAARSAARHLRRLKPGAVAPLLKSRIDAALAAADSRRVPRLVCAAHEAAAPFRGQVLYAPDDLEALRHLVSLSHHADDEPGALSRMAAEILRQTRAIGVAVFAAGAARPVVLASAGHAGEPLAERAIAAGQRIGPERAGGGVECALPVHFLSRCVGAIVLRWSVEGPPGDRPLAFAGAAAAACAPVLYVAAERRQPARAGDVAGLLGDSAAMAIVRKAVARAANAPFAVLIEGESGSGKEVVARAIHLCGSRRDRRFCALNCAAMPEDLIDAELFGHAKGAFTGASLERAGLFESADGGTVFLDEVAELSPRAQAKLLRVLQEGEVRRVGETFTRPFDARLIAATNRPLRAEADAGRFRTDLLYRLDVIRISVPPLRERRDDVPQLAAHFWNEAARRVGSKAALGPAAFAALARYDWPGNVRELQNVMAALVVNVAPRGVVSSAELPAAIAGGAAAARHATLETARHDFEQRFVRAALAQSGGHRGRTAAALGVSRQGLAKLMQRLHLDG